MIHPVINMIRKMVQIFLLEVAARKINTMANCRTALKGGLYGSAYVSYYLFPYTRFLAQAQFFIVYEPIVSKLHDFALSSNVE